MRKFRLTPGGLGRSAPLLAANLLEALLPFARNVALAHLIAPSDFGLAISLSVVIGMLEVLTDFGLPIFAVRKDTIARPDQPAGPIAGSWQDAMMGTLQSLALVRAAILAGLLFAVSPWVAAAFQASDSTWVYAMLGLIVLIRGFENFGVKAMMRQFVFWREAIMLASAQVVGLALTVTIAALHGGFTCMIWGMLGTTVTTVTLSHVLSPTPYRLRWNREAAREAAVFGRPLLVNGLAVSLNLSDRLLVGGVLGPGLLALYNVAYGTAQLPRSVMTKFLTSAFLPLFVQDRERGRSAPALYDTWAWCVSCLAFAYGLGLSLIGDRMLALVFGATYQPSRLFMCLAGLSVCVKFLMLLPVPSAYASGNTRLIAFGSILSAISVIPGALLLVWRHDVELFLAGLTAAEFVALMVFGRIALRQQAFTRSAGWLAIGTPLLLLASLASLTLLLPELSFGKWLAACSVALCLSVAVYGLMVPRFRIGRHALQPA